jgi:DNA-binding CsgD family transcriptional regulator
VPAEELAGRLGRYGGELVRLVPEAEGVPGLAPPLQSDPETERYRLFDAVAAWLAAASRDEPILLVLDDLQWADRETRSAIPFLSDRVSLVAAVRRGDPATPATLDALRDVGFAVLELEPLDDGAAAELLHGLRPGLALRQAEALVRRTGGNPLLLEELAASGEPTESLQLALAARLRVLTPSGREAMGLLSLAGRPLEVTALGSAASEVAGAGLAVRLNGSIAARHALLAETAAAALSDEERRHLHLRLAALLEDPGERARHYADAGDRARAFAEAMRAVAAATTPGERASHLELAALSADGPDADRLRVAAAAALAEAGRSGQALAVIESVADTDPQIVATRHLYRARVCLGRVAVESARAECEAGLALVAGGGSEIEARLALEDAQIAQRRVLFFDLEPSVAEAKATHALDLAHGSVDLEALARRVIGSVGLLSQAPGWDEELRRALELARASGSFDLEFGIVANLGFGLLISGRLDEARELYETSIERAGEQRLTDWERGLRWSLVGNDWHSGALRVALDECLRLVAEAERHSLYRAQVLADLGLHDESLIEARKLVARALPNWQSLGNALWALADAELAAGHARESVAAADEALERFGDEGPTAFLQVTRAWARHDLGRAPDRVVGEIPQPIAEGAAPELVGLSLLAENRNAEAAVSFAEAAALWQGRHFRGHLRSLWAEGEALRRAADSRAIETLERAEAVALAHNEVPVLRRIHRSLRLAGVRRSAPRGVLGELTLREREVLALVAEGASNSDIARRLGLGRPTVERLVQSASRKLGATTRAQAAALAASR